jgi:hypothetical protein
MHRAWTLAFVFVGACGRRTETAPASPDASHVAPAAAGASASAAPVTVPAVAAVVDAGHDAHVEAEAPPAPPPKHYKTVIHMGDSMVGGGLCKALAPKFKEEGTKFIRDVWESASIAMYDDSDRIPTMMKRWNPDLVLLTLGANDVFNDHPEYAIKHVESIVKKLGHRDCVWIGPPLWKGDKGLVAMLKDHVAPCRFYDSQHLVLARAGDGIHPTEKGGEVWADAFWPFFKGTDTAE